MPVRLKGQNSIIMKGLPFVLLLLLSSVMVQAQGFQEVKKSMSQGEHNAYVLNFDIGDAETIADLWVDYQKDEAKQKPKFNKGTKEYLADDAEIKDISNNTIDIYSTVTSKEKGKGAIVHVWFDLGGAYLSSARHPERMAATKQWLSGFNKQVRVAFAEQLLEAEEDKLKDLQKELKDAEKTKSNAESDISKLEKELEEARNEVKESTKMISEKQAAVKEQEAKVEAAKAKVKQ